MRVSRGTPGDDSSLSLQLSHNHLLINKRQSLPSTFMSLEPYFVSTVSHYNLSAVLPSYTAVNAVVGIFRGASCDGLKDLPLRAPPPRGRRAPRPWWSLHKDCHH